MTLTVDDLRLHVTTDLGDAALGDLLDAAYEAIDLHAGTSGAITEVISAGPGDLLMLSRPASAITSVKEGRSFDTTLSTDDWELVGDQLLHRLDDGTNPRTSWYRRIEVTYTRLTDAAERDRVAIALVKLDLDTNPGLSSQRIGEWAETFEATDSYSEARAAILASLAPTFIAA